MTRVIMRFLMTTAWINVAISAAAEQSHLGRRLSSSSSDSATVSGSLPVLGFVAGSSSNELTVLCGITGAANADGKIHLPGSVSRSYIAPRGGYVLVEKRDAIGVLLLDDPGVQGIAEPVIKAIDGTAIGADAVVFSPSGSAAAVVTSNTIQVIAGLPVQPQLLALSSSLPSDGRRVLAVSDDGAAIAIWSSVGTDIISASGLQRLHTGPEVPSAAFLGSSHDLILGDRSSGSVIIFRETSGYSPVGIARLETPTRPDRLAATENADFVLAVSADDLRLFWVEVSTGLTGSIRLPATPDRLDAIRARDVFIISAAAGEPVWAIAWRSGSPQIFFVPRTGAVGNQ